MIYPISWLNVGSVISVSRKTGILGVIAGLVMSACSTGNEVAATTSTLPSADPTTAATVRQTTTVPQATNTSASSPDATVTIENFSFTVAADASVGAQITIQNQDSASHTWTSVDEVFDSDGLAPGDTFEFTFSEPGEYAFFCKFHPTQMTGRITVNP